MKDKTFIILSNQPFDQDLPTNKWHIATRLAKRGYDVVYVDPPLRFKALKSFLKHPSFNLSHLFFRTEKKNDHLVVYKPANIFNFWPFSKWNTHIHSKKVNELVLTYDQEHKTKHVMWVYHFDYPELQDFLGRIEHDLLIYDVVDEYTVFPEYAERKKVNPGVISWIQWGDDELKIRINQKGVVGVDWVLQQEKWLAENAGLMFASAPDLATKFEKWRDTVYYLPNAAAVEKFDQPKESFSEPDDIKEIPHPRIGFTGAIDGYKNDIKLIERCAQEHPTYQYVLIGPERLTDPDLDLSVLKKMDNVHFLGKRPWDKTPSYFAYFDAYFIPYKIKGCHPVKYFETLAAGLPTVITDLPSMKGFDVDGYVSKTDEEFVENIQKAVEENTPEKVEKRKELARENSWDGKVNKQLKLIQEYFDSHE